MNVSNEKPGAGPCAELETPPRGVASSGAEAEEARTLLGIRQARDLVLAKNRELIDKLALAEDQIAELTYERDDLTIARDAALKKTRDFEEENAGLRAQVAQLSEERAAMTEVEQIYVLARTEIEADMVTLAEERDAAVETGRGHALELTSLRAELEAAQVGGKAASQLAAQLEDAIRELAEARDAKGRLTAEHQETVARLAEQVAAAERKGAETQREVERVIAERAALQKNSAAEIAALEARLTALAAQKPKATPAPAKGHPTRLPGPPPPIVPPPPAAAAPAPSAPPTAQLPALSDQELRAAIEAIHRQLEAILAAPETPELLAHFNTQLRQLADRSETSGLALIHHICAASCEFTSRLRQNPARVGPALPALEKTVEMLGWLGLRGRAEMIETHGALVYAVDDDVDNCECLATAFEKVALQTKYSVRPEIALEQIAANPCELIVLDVDLPGMDGFEVHARLRKMPGRELTPVIFLSGHLSAIERLTALADDNAEFVAKPYNLSELCLRALTRIVEARLG